MQTTGCQAFKISSILDNSPEKGAILNAVMKFTVSDYALLGI